MTGTTRAALHFVRPWTSPLLHAWAEVAIKANNNFYWLPVDPTWNMINPTNVIKANDYESILDNFVLKLRKIRYEDGEIVVY